MTDKPTRRKRAPGSGPRGEANAHHKLMEADIQTIREIGNSRSAEDVARDYGVTPQTIYQIMGGTTWKHVSLAGDTAGRRPRKPRAQGLALTREAAQEILNARATRTRHTATELVERHHVSRQTIENIWDGKTWKHLQPAPKGGQP